MILNKQGWLYILIYHNERQHGVCWQRRQRPCLCRLCQYHDARSTWPCRQPLARSRADLPLRAWIHAFDGCSSSPYRLRNSAFFFFDLIWFCLLVEYWLPKDEWVLICQKEGGIWRGIPFWTGIWKKCRSNSDNYMVLPFQLLGLL